MREAIVVGGGFFGASVAHYLKARRGFGRVTLLERESAVMTRSSFVNQARVHGGYHYPRSFTTAFRSRVNMPRFCADFPETVTTPFLSVYAIARQQSKVTPGQMERFCSAIGAPLEPAPDDIAALFNPRLVAQAWMTEEKVFDADLLRDTLLERLRASGVELRCNAEVTALASGPGGATVTATSAGTQATLDADFVFNCSYSNLQRLGGASAPRFDLRHETAEIVLVDPPAQLKGIGITVMDGPFFSIIPFPARSAHSLTHVRYTPHAAWPDRAGEDPLTRRDTSGSRADWMIRDAARYVPSMSRVVPKATMFEVKTVLQRSEGNDSRPILFARHGEGERLISILGGKIDNIYDVFEQLDRETFDSGRAAA